MPWTTKIILNITYPKFDSNLPVFIELVHGSMICPVFSSAKEKADVDQMQEPSVKAFFQDQSQYDAKFTKEQVGTEVFTY